MKRIAVAAGSFIAIFGLAVFAIGVAAGTSSSVHAGADDTTPADATTPGAGGSDDSTPGPLTPVADPTETGDDDGLGDDADDALDDATDDDGGVAGESTLPTTGTGGTFDGGADSSPWIAGLGMLFAVLGAGVAFAGYQRRT